MSTHTYYVRTYDYELHAYTPQNGVIEGPYSLWQLRDVIRELRTLFDDESILVERDDHRTDGKRHC